MILPGASGRLGYLTVLFEHTQEMISLDCFNFYRPHLLTLKFSFQLITRAKGNVKLYRNVSN